MKYQFRVRPRGTAAAGIVTGVTGAAMDEDVLHSILTDNEDAENVLEDFDDVAATPDDLEDSSTGEFSPAVEESVTAATLAGAALSGEALSPEELGGSTVPLGDLAGFSPDQMAAVSDGATREMNPLDFEASESDEEEEPKKKKKVGAILLWIFIPLLLVLLLAFGASQLLLYSGRTEVLGVNIQALDFFGLAPIVHEELVVEVGSEEIAADDFINQKKNSEGLKAEFLEGIFDMNTVGKYYLTLRYDGREYEVVLRIEDTVPPTAKVKVALIQAGENLLIEDLLEDIYDRTDVEVAVSELDTDAVGVQEVTLRLKDAGGNETVYKTRVYVAEKVNSVVYEVGGGDLSPQDFVLGLPELSFADADAMTFKKPGTYSVKLLCGNDVIEVPLVVADTVAPQVVAKDNVELLSTSLPEPSSLLESITDATTTTVKYKEDYRFTEDGMYRVTVVVTDEGGNETEVEVPIFVYATELTEAPLILAGDFTVELGSAIAFRKYLRVIDAVDGELDIYDTAKVQFDQNLVDVNKVGSYVLTVTAVDSDGNTASKTITVTVEHLKMTLEQVYEYIRGILFGENGIIKEGMTREQQLRAVFDYITKTSGMTYTGTSDKNNLYHVEAYYGFTLKQGDCYTYCCMSRVMLECLEIDYHVVSRSGTRLSNHYWLLADFGDGWYHYDTCYHTFTWTKPTFKLTDGEVAAYTEWYNTKANGWNYYQFDQSLYPRTPVLEADGSYTYSNYTITYTAGNGGSIVGETQQAVGHGQTTSAVTAAPAPGYVFKGWSDGVSEATRTDIAMGDTTITAEFTVGVMPDKSYVLSYTAENGGYISGKATQNIYEGYYGSAVTAVANAGYIFKNWSDGVTTATRTDIAEKNLTVSAVFVKDTSAFTFIYLPGSGGTITGKTTQVVSGGQTGTAVTAVPNLGYRFVRWSDGVTTAERSDKAGADLTVTAIFEKDTQTRYTLVYAAGEGGSIQGETTQSILVGTTGSAVTAVPSPGYLFKCWSDGSEDPTRSDPALKDQTLTAYFEPDPSQIVIEYRAGFGGNLKGTLKQMMQFGQTTTTVTAVPMEGYVFDSWSDGLTTPSRSDFARSSMILTAYFKKKETTVTVNFTATEGGSLQGTLSQTVTLGSTTETVTAVPSEGYTFDGWYNGDTRLSSELSYSTSPQSNLTITARFSALPVVTTYHYVFVSSEGGSISGNSNQTVNSGSYCETVSAIAAEGYVFDGWYNGDTLLTTETSLTLLAGEGGSTEMTITAKFKAIEPAVEPTV